MDRTCRVSPLPRRTRARHAWRWNSQRRRTDPMCCERVHHFAAAEIGGFVTEEAAQVYPGHRVQSWTLRLLLNERVSHSSPGVLRRTPLTNVEVAEELDLQRRTAPPHHITRGFKVISERCHHHGRRFDGRARP